MAKDKKSDFILDEVKRKNITGSSPEDVKKNIESSGQKFDILSTLVGEKKRRGKNDSPTTTSKEDGGVDLSAEIQALNSLAPEIRDQVLNHPDLPPEIKQAYDGQSTGEDESFANDLGGFVNPPPGQAMPTGRGGMVFPSGPGPNAVTPGPTPQTFPMMDRVTLPGIPPSVSAPGTAQDANGPSNPLLGILRQLLERKLQNTAEFGMRGQSPLKGGIR